jgi:hypothetical protein
MILPDETKAGTAGTQPCLAISRWAPRDDERGVLAPPNLHRIERPHALKTPIRRAESTSIARARYVPNLDILRIPFRSELIRGAV